MKKKLFYISIVTLAFFFVGCSERGLDKERLRRFKTEVLPNDAYQSVKKELDKFNGNVYLPQLTEVYQAESDRIAESDRMAKMFFGSDLFKGLEGNQNTVYKLYEQLSDGFYTLGLGVAEQVKSNPVRTKNILDAVINNYHGKSMADSLKKACNSKPYSELLYNASQDEQVMNTLKNIGRNMKDVDLRPTFALAIKDNNGWVIDNQKLAAKDAKNRSNSNIILHYVLAVVMRDAIVEALKGQNILYIHQNEENENVFEIGLSNNNAYRLAFDKKDNMVCKQIGFNEMYMGEGVED